MRRHCLSVEQLRAALADQLAESMGAIQREQSTLLFARNPGEEEDPRYARADSLGGVGRLDADPPPVTTAAVGPFFPDRQVRVVSCLRADDVKMPSQCQRLDPVGSGAEQDGVVGQITPTAANQSNGEPDCPTTSTPIPSSATSPAAWRP